MSLHTQTVGRDVLRGTGALLASIALLAGVPLALWALAGNPLPAGVPSLDEVERALTEGQVSDSTLIKMLAIACWLAWIEIATAFVAEAFAALRGRSAPTVPGAGRLQGLAATLVTTLTLSFAAGGSQGPQVLARLSPTAMTTEPTASHISMPSSAPAGTQEPAPGGSTDRSEQLRGVGTSQNRSGQPTHVVAHRESLWGIAERRLGDPHRWVEIFELNRGRVQADGAALARPDTPLHIGWKLLLPAGTTPGGKRVPSDEGPAENRTITVERGDTLWDLAGEHLDDPFRWPELFERNRSVEQPDGGRLSDPDLILPGWELELPTAPIAGDPDPGAPTEPEPAGRGADPSRSADETEDGPEPTSADGDVADVEEEDGASEDVLGDLVASGARLAGAGLAAAGLVWTINRLRRTQERRRRPGWRIRRPTAEGAVAEAELRAAADFDAAERVDLALRALASRAVSEDRQLPEITSVTVASDRVDIDLAESLADPVRGFDAVGGGRTWSVRADAITSPPEPSGADPVAPLPALASIGYLDDSTAGNAHYVLVNFEHLGAVSVVGPGSDIVETLRTIAWELATTNRADDVRVVVVGFGEELSELERIEVASSLDEVLPEFERAADSERRAMEQWAIGSGFEGRMAGKAEPWAPTVVLCAGESDPTLLRRLVALGSDPRSGIVAVVGGDAGAEHRIEVDDTVVRLDTLELAAHRPRLEDDLAGGLGITVEAAIDLDGVPGEPGEPPVRAVERHAPGTGTATAPTVQESRLEVRVLGPVEVWDSRAGAPLTFAKSKALELVVHLALHRRGVTPDVLKTALWPDRLPHWNTLSNVTSAARRALGTDDSGEPHLPRQSSDGHYRLSAAVGCDYERFVQHTQRAKHSGDEETISELVAALELVRGQPFSDTPGEYHWAYMEALVSSATAEAADAAHRLVELCLQTGDLDRARWAARQGLLASPANEQLYRDRMLIADLLGNPAGVDEVWKELCRALEEPGNDACDMPHEQTRALYAELTGRAPRQPASRG